MPKRIQMLFRVRNVLTPVVLLAGSSAFAQTVRYELFPEPEVRQTATTAQRRPMSLTRRITSSGCALCDTIIET